MKVIDFIRDLESWREKYDDLRGLIEDQIKDNQIDEAELNFAKLLKLKSIIAEMESFEIDFREMKGE
ncbi:MAG: hypothetical protein RR595_05680 [Lysinibacillus sp.]